MGAAIVGQRAPISAARWVRYAIGVSYRRIDCDTEEYDGYEWRARSKRHHLVGAEGD